MWIDDPAKWDRLADRLLAAGEAGIDTETYGQPQKTSPQHRARVHCWSVAIVGRTRSPRGYPLASGVVLPRSALDHGPLRDALRGIQLWAHNAPHDHHALANEGLEVTVHDTLQWARVTIPGVRDYGLKAMRRWALGKPERPDFADLVTYVKRGTRWTHRTETRCVCSLGGGAVPCRRQKKTEYVTPPTESAPGGLRLNHLRFDLRIPTEYPTETEERYAVTDFVPGAVMEPMTWKGRQYDRLAAWWEYSLADAVDGIELVHWLRGRDVAAERPGAPGREYPWRTRTS